MTRHRNSAVNVISYLRLNSVDVGAITKTDFGRVYLEGDKPLRGKSPTNLPIEQPSKFELVLNLKAADKLGLTFSPQLLLRTDEVIESALIESPGTKWTQIDFRCSAAVG